MCFLGRIKQMLLRTKKKKRGKTAFSNLLFTWPIKKEAVQQLFAVSFIVGAVNEKQEPKSELIAQGATDNLEQDPK